MAVSHREPAFREPQGARRLRFRAIVPALKDYTLPLIARFLTGR